MLDDYLRTNNWNVVDIQKIPAREGELFSYNDMGLSKQALEYLGEKFPKGIYKHQKKAILECLQGENICLTTGTASGKSQVIYVTAIEKIIKNPQTKIIAIYPLRALGNEQEQRWSEALQMAGLKATVGRIDGQVLPVAKRIEILRNS
jgi:DEAD/DEAH box helicase domain-containing protein